MRRFKYVFLISLVIIVLDQITKHLVLKYMNPFESIVMFCVLFCLIVRMTGVVFVIFNGFCSSLFIAVSVRAIIFVIWLLIRSIEGDFGLSLILGGAIGNLIDRLRYGWVVDFIDFSIGKFHWPAFNVADSALTIGVIVVLLSSQLHG